jgi:integrase
MSQVINRLSASFVRNVSQPGRHGDGGGLYLQVTPAGDAVTKAWLFRFALNGRKRDMGLGSIHTFSLLEARERARQCRQLLHDGVDPIEHRNGRRAEAKAEAAKTITFEQAAAACVADKRHAWRAGRNGGYEAEVTSTLRTYAFPVLGALPVGAIETAQIVTALRSIWTDKPETARRVRGRIETVLAWATARGFCSGPNPARWKGHLENILATPQAREARVKHLPALPYTEVPAFMARVRAADDPTARALELLILTGARLQELRKATWDEIDLAAALWALPPERTKQKREHRVPLAPCVVALLKALPRDPACPYVFPGIKSARKPLDAIALRKALRAIPGSEGITLHGFRSSFSDWAHDCTSHQPDEIEAALGHVVGNRVKRAYRRGDGIEKRAALMRDWSKFCQSRP